MRSGEWTSAQQRLADMDTDPQDGLLSQEEFFAGASGEGICCACQADGDDQSNCCANR